MYVAVVCACTYSRSISGPLDEPAVSDDLETICNWLTSQGFRLNINKVKAMVISRKKSPPCPHLELQGDKLEYVNNFRLLGVIITNDLSWKSHILHITSKARRLLGFLYRVFNEGGPCYLNKLYKSIVLPHLDYCCCVWDPPHKTHIEKLERVQSFAARVVSGNWTRDASELKSSLQWPSLASRRLHLKLCLCHKIVTGASIIEPSFFPNAPRRCASHKNSLPLFRPYVRTLHHRNSFKWAIVEHWNRVPEEVATIKSTAAFKRSLMK